MIHWELCKKFKFNHINKWYIHNPESILENETHKILGDFDKQTDHLISARPSDSQQKKENLLNSRLCRSSWLPGKTERKQKREKYLDLQLIYLGMNT